MTHRLWNLDKFEGRARTQYVLDAEFFAIGAAPFATVTGTGTATIEATADIQPRIVLGNGAGTGTSKVTIGPPVFTPAVLAIILDIEGLGMSGDIATGRCNLHASFTAGSDGSVGVGVKADNASARLWSRIGGGLDREAKSLAGNAYPVPNTSVGFMLDYNTSKMLGHMGWSMAGLNAPVPSTAGVPYQFAITNSGTTQQSVFFTKATATVVWKRLGSESIINVRP